MKLASVSSFYRFSDSGSVEDGIAMDCQRKIFAVLDAVSPPFSPKNKKENYSPYEGLFLSGGEMVAIIASKEISRYSPLDLHARLIESSDRIMEMQRRCRKDPLKNAVAGACVAACQVYEDRFEIIVAGDCFALFQDEKGFHFITNFDQAAYDFEEKGNEVFEQCLKKAGGDKGKAWDSYIEYFAEKQFFRANRNLGKGGHAMFNGDPAFSKCWTKEIISFDHKPLWLLLGTDGLLHRDFRPERIQVNDLAFAYLQNRLQGILEWQKGKNELPHVKRPELSALELKFEQ